MEITGDKKKKEKVQSKQEELAEKLLVSHQVQFFIKNHETQFLPGFMVFSDKYLYK
jgi:hypothetical protein